MKRLVAIEFDTESTAGWPWWKPGVFRGTLGGKPTMRVWWWCFAMMVCHVDLHEYGQMIRDGRAEWMDK